MKSHPSAWLHRAARLVGLGVRAELRNSGLRLLAFTLAASAAVFAWNQGDTAATTAVVLGDWIGRFFGVAACLWFGYAAIRDYNERTGAALRSKPMDGAFWILVNWGTGICVWLIMLGAGFLGAALAQLPHAGLSSLASHGAAFLQSAAILVAVSTLSFTLSRIWRSPLGGIVALLGWFCAMAGAQFIPAFLQPDYAQNLGVFLGAAAVMLGVTALLVERFRRGELRRPLPALAGLVLLVALAGAGAAQAYRVTPRPEERQFTIWDQISRQHLIEGEKVPGFWLPDGKGGIVRTAEHPGEILVLFLFASTDTTAAQTLPAMEAVQREFGSRGVQPIGICFTPDRGDGWLISRTSGHGFPIAWDPTTQSLDAPPQAALADAYNIQLLPMLVVTDRRHRVRAVGHSSSYTSGELRQLIDQRLAAEPE